MTVRTSFVVVLLGFAGCASSNVEISKTQAPPTSPTRLTEVSPESDNSISFDTNEPIGVMNQREVAVVADYIGLSVDEAYALAAKQNRLPGVCCRDNKQLGMTAVFAAGRIEFTVTDGIVAGAEFPCGLDRYNEGIIR